MNILMVRPNPRSKSDGIAVYCEAINSMFANDKYVNVLPIVDYETRNFPLLNGVYKFRSFFKNIKGSNPDIVHINGYASFTIFQAFVAAIFLKKIIIYTAHWHPFDKLSRPLAGKLFFYVFLYPMIKLFADIIITLNKEDTSFFSRISKKIIQIPHWLKFNVNMDDNVSKCKKMILFVGRVSDSNKGIEHLFKLPEDIYDINIVGYGELETRKDMKRHVNISNDELINLYKKASLLVVPSKYEAFSLVSLEALMCGTPVVISDNVRIADYLNGVSGVSIFRYGDYNDFIKKVKVTIGTEVDIEKVKDIFDFHTIKNKYKELYIKI